MANEPQKKNTIKWSKWQREDVTPVSLCKGVDIDSSIYESSENRYLTLLIKGFICFLLSAGAIGSYLTALEIEYSQIVVNLFVLITALVCAILYHSWKSENLGYLVFFVVLATFLIIFKNYINSGFYAVINDTIEWASIYFDTEGLQYYNERIANRYVAITIAMIAIGIAMNVLLNNYILRRARYWVAIFMTITVNIIPFYMQKEPDTIYTIMMLSGILMTYVLKCGQHFSLSRNDHIYEKSKNGLSYSLDYKSLWQGFATVIALVLMIAAVVTTVFPKTTYDIRQEQSEAKEISRDTMQTLIMVGIMGLINYYPNNGGLSTGELGGVSYINLDYETDIRVTYTPYTYDTLYIRNFMGIDYHPYNNNWTQPHDFISGYAGTRHEAEALKDAYENGDKYGAKGVMSITNVDVSALPFFPYYYADDGASIGRGNSKTYTYYPRFNDSQTVVPKHEIPEEYLQVPNENVDAIKNVLEDAGIERGDEQVVAAEIKDYFQENIPYTIRPGATPWRRDFINYFLEDNRKGYCAHFASAATLMFRYLGIPARYCEGYAVSMDQVFMDGELVEDAEYSNYYDGYSELGETGLVRIDVTDASAHAWVEIYDEEYGWIPVEVTPSASIDEDDQVSDFWENFNDAFGDGNDTTNANPGGIAGLGNTINDTVMKYVAYILIALMVIAALIFTGRFFMPELKYKVAYNKAGLSDKLILRYQRFARNKGKRDPDFKSKVNYSEQLFYMIPKNKLSGEGTALGQKRQRIMDILERAGFSNKEISEEEFGYVMSFIEEIENASKKRKK